MWNGSKECHLRNWLQNMCMGLFKNYKVHLWQLLEILCQEKDSFEIALVQMLDKSLNSGKFLTLFIPWYPYL